MSEFPSPVADYHIGSSGHAGMYGVMAEQQAERRVVGGGRHGSDRIAGVDVLQVQFHVLAMEVLLYGILEKQADIAKTDIAGCVMFTGLFHEILASSFGNNDHSMPSQQQPLVQRLEKTLQGEW